MPPSYSCLGWACSRVRPPWRRDQVPPSGFFLSQRRLTATARDASLEPRRHKGKSTGPMKTRKCPNFHQDSADPVIQNRHYSVLGLLAPHIPSPSSILPVSPFQVSDATAHRPIRMARWARRNTCKSSTKAFRSSTRPPEIRSWGQIASRPIWSGFGGALSDRRRRRSRCSV